MAIVFIDSKSKNLPDSGAHPDQKFGSAAGEQRIALEGNWEKDPSLFDFYTKNVDFYFFTKSDLLEYIESIKEEINHPTQTYPSKINVQYYTTLKDCIEQLKDEIHILHFTANGRKGGTPYINIQSNEEQKLYNEVFRSICLSSSKQGLNNAYTIYKFDRYQDTNTKKYYINLVPIFSKKYNMEELVSILKRANVECDEKIINIQMFALQYAKHIIEQNIDVHNLCTSAGISDEEIEKCINENVKLFRYLDENKISINPVSDKTTVIGAYLQKKYRSNVNDEKMAPLQQIFYGAPGTGKSNTIKREIEDKGKIHYRTTFHPDSDYSTFVGCYKPTKNVRHNLMSYAELIERCKEYAKREGYNNQNLTQFGFDYYDSLIEVLKDKTLSYASLLVSANVTDTSASSYVTAGVDLHTKIADKIAPITYDFVPQTFVKAYCDAWNHYTEEKNEDIYLIIEEINRGNCAQIFGDLFQLLDRENTGDRCGFSTYPIDADEDLKKFLMNGTKEDGTPWLVNKDGIKNGKLCLPPNLYIWATMNTSDQSLFPIDSAFKRRWDWKYVPINCYKKSDWYIDLGINGKFSWSSFLENINKEIFETTKSEDKQLGFFFCNSGDGKITADRFVGKVLFYIYNDVFKDYDFSREFFKAGGTEIMPFHKCFEINGDVNTTNVANLLRALKVETIGDEFSEEDLDDGPDVSPGQKDYSTYSINDEDDNPLKKCNLPENVLRKYIEKNENLTLDDVKSAWNTISSEMGDICPKNFVETEQDFENRIASSNDKTARNRSTKVEWSGNTLYVTKQWNINSITKFIEVVDKRDWGIKIKKLS